MLKVNIGGFKQFLSSLFLEEESFLRELVQNSMEAINARIKEESKQNTGLINIITDDEARTFTVLDNGCGLTKAELEENLGQAFLTGWSEQSAEPLGVGQFGFGFFSSMRVAERIEVLSRPQSMPDRSIAWNFDCESGKDEFVSVKEQLKDCGFSVTLHLGDDKSYMTSSEYIIGILKRYLLFCPYKIKVNGHLLDIETRAQWNRNICDQRSEAYLVQDLQNQFGWDSPPLAILPIKNGVLAIVPKEEKHAPPSKIYRHGVFVLDTEIIPEPLNHIFCGIFNVDDLSIRPDRKSYIDDEHAAKFKNQLIENVSKLYLRIGEYPEQISPFLERWLDLMVVGVLTQDDLAHLRFKMPIRKITGRGIELSMKTTWEELTSDLPSDSILYTEDPVKDRALLYSTGNRAEIILNLPNMHDLALAKLCADETEINLVEITDNYATKMKENAVRNPKIEGLFRGISAIGNYEVICVVDDVSSIPIRLIRLETESGEIKRMLSELGEMAGLDLPEELILDDDDEEWTAILNLAHPAIDVINTGLKSGANSVRLRTCAEVLSYSARMAAAEEATLDDQIALANSLADLMANAINGTLENK